MRWLALSDGKSQVTEVRLRVSHQRPQVPVFDTHVLGWLGALFRSFLEFSSSGLQSPASEPLPFRRKIVPLLHNIVDTLEAIS
jgi:hypothetical protein